MTAPAIGGVGGPASLPVVTGWLAFRPLAAGCDVAEVGSWIPRVGLNAGWAAAGAVSARGRCGTEGANDETALPAPVAEPRPCPAACRTDAGGVGEGGFGCADV